MLIKDLNTIIQELGKRESFTIEELKTVLAKLYVGKSENTLRWKIHELKQKGIIHHITRGFYTLALLNQSYSPEISEEAKEVYKSIQQELPYTELSMVQTGWFNEFMRHQVFKTYLIIEVERDAVLTVFNRLSDQGKAVFLDPGREIFDYYISRAENPIIIKPLISESPLINKEEIKIASLEKLLVDFISDTDVYGAQFQEASSIFENTMEKYAINIGRLKRYARRRNKIKKLETYFDLKSIE